MALDLYHAMGKALERINSLENNVGRMAHVLSMQLSGPLTHMLDDRTAIEVGMVLATRLIMEHLSS